ncbi:MAG: group II truncated hemoglobin [Myxococcales bacterium]|nr:group II truncated hemoglobin [Myxococcales bacterium]
MTIPFGTRDASFAAAGGVAGIERLVDDFYDLMDTLPEAARIRAMHPDDLTVARDKLARFLSGWLGGPRRYAEKYGALSIPGAHARFPIEEADRTAWLHCMALAIARQPWDEAFAAYLLEQLGVPARRIVEVCALERAAENERAAEDGEGATS